jgi:drug/metabolite transporter (DMT)-like permease
LARQIKPHVAVLSANILFGVNYAAVQYITGRFIQPFGLNFIRVLIPALLFWLLALVYRSQTGIQRKHIGRFLLCSLTGVVINQLLFIKGLSMTTVIHATLLNLVTPIFITIVAAYFLKEKFSVFKVAGLVFGITGAAMLVVRREGNGDANDMLLGDLFILINAISYTFYFVLVRPLMEEYRPVHVLRWIFTLGLPAMFLFGWNEFTEVDWSVFTVNEYLVLALIVVGATFLAYTLNLYGIQKLGASITGAYIYTQPVFAAAVAMILLGETHTLYKGTAALLIITGVFLAGRKNKSNGKN